MTGIAGKSLLAVCAVLIVFRSVAYADSLRLRIEDVGAGEGVVLTDTEGVGFINFVGSIGGFVLNITTGNSKPVIGGINNFGELDLSSINISGPGSGTLRITLEDDSYKLGPIGFVNAASFIKGTFDAPKGSSVSFQSWANSLNFVPDLGQDQEKPGALKPIGSIPLGSVAVFNPPATFGPGPLEASGSTSLARLGSYSLFAQATLTFTGPGEVTFDQTTQVTAAPEPASLFLLGSGLAGLGLLGRKRKSIPSARNNVA